MNQLKTRTPAARDDPCDTPECCWAYTVLMLLVLLRHKKILMKNHATCARMKLGERGTGKFTGIFSVRTDSRERRDCLNGRMGKCWKTYTNANFPV